MPDPVGTRRRYRFGSVAVALVIAGLLVNVYLAVVARAMAPSDYLYFSAYWSISLVVGFGLFLPVEQELARVLPTSAAPARDVRGILWIVGALAGVEVVVIAAALPLLLHSLGGHVGIVGALAVLGVVSAGQFTLRGLLVGAGRMGTYAGVLIADSALRVGLAAMLSTLAHVGSSSYAWTLVAAIAISHLPLLFRNLRAPMRGQEPLARSAIRAKAAGIAHLLAGSLAAQVLLNGLPALVALNPAEVDRAHAANFQAAFQLVRIPLFFAVPIQATIVPALVALLGTASRRATARVVARFVALLAAVGAAGVLVAATLGPTLLRLVYGPRYHYGRADFVVLTCGVVLYLGLIVITQALVATERHADVSRTWVSGVVVAFVVYVVMPDPVTAAQTGLAAGAATGCAVGIYRLLAASSIYRERIA